MTRKGKRAIIIGAGIGGLSAGIALRKVGFDVTIYESKPTVRFAGAGLLVGANAAQALDRLGVWPQVQKVANVLQAMDIVTPEGKLLSRTPSNAAGPSGYPENVTILRSDLLAVLADALGDATIYTDKACTGSDLTDSGARVRFADGTEAECDLLIAADGVHSPLRQQLLPAVNLRYSGYICWRGIVEADASWNFDRGIFTEAWGTGARFGVAPLANDKVYWYACLNARHGHQPHLQDTAQDLLQLFGTFHEPVPAILERTGVEPMLLHDIVYVPPLRQFAFGRAALLGDAAHATTPNLGQGAAQALEDAVVLAAQLRDTADIGQALRNYARIRAPRAGRVMRMSNRVGGLAQWESRLAVAWRDWLVPRMPAKSVQSQFDYLHGVELPRL